MVFGTIGGIVATSVFGLAAGSAGATIVGGLIGGGLAFGAQTLLGQYLNRPKARPYGAVQGDIQIGGNIPSQAIFGKGKTKGHRLYYAKYAPGDEINSEVLVLSNGWCDGLEPYVYFYGKKFDLVELPKIGNEVAHYGIPDYWYDNNPNGENCFSIRFYDGRPGQQVDQRLVDETANLDTPWKATSTVAGHAYVVVRKRFDGDHDFAENGNPEMEFVLRGLREYDPRKDSTVAGGSGTHRVDDPATYEWTENPALHRLNYQLGLRGLISNRTIIGEGKTLGQLDLGTYFAAMNVCDTLRNGKPTYACSLVVNADDDHTEVLKEFDDAMAGYGLNRRGLSGVIAGAPQLPVLEITRDDIPADRAKELRYRKSAFELYNHMSGQFTSIEDQWHPVSLDPIHVNADVAADGRVRQTSNDFLQVTDPDIAQYLLTIRYRQQRLGGKVTLPVSRRVGLAVSEGEWVESEGREWLVQRWSVDEDFRFTLTLAETSANVYASEGIQPGPIVVPSTPPINPSLLSNVQDFNVEVGTVTGADGSEVPCLRFTWTPPGDLTIDTVRFQYGPGSTVPAKPFSDVCADPEAGEYVTTKNVSSARFYTARATITTTPDRFKTWSQWKTTAQATGPFDIYAEIDLDQLGEDVQANLQWISGGLRTVETAFAELSKFTVDQDWQNQSEFRGVRTLIAEREGAITAQYESLITTAIEAVDGEILAVSQRVETLEVEVDGKAGVNVTDALSARITENDGELQTVAQQVSALEIEVDGKAGLTITDALDARVTQTGNSLTSTGRTVRDIRNAVELASLLQSDQDWAVSGEVAEARRISADYYQRVSSDISVTNAGLSAAVEAIEVLEVALTGYNGSNAVAAAFSAQSARITATEEDITAVATSVEGVEAQVNDVSAGGSIKFEAAASPGGGWSRVGLYASADDGVTFEEAAIFLDARTDGTPGSRIAVVADQFVITDGTSEALPFVFQGGVGYLSSIRVDWALIDNAQIDWADIANVQIDWADIDTAVVENLVVETSNIGFAAVTEQFTLEGNTEDLTQSGTWQTVASFTIERAEGVFFNTIGAASVGASENGARRTRLIRSDGVVVYENGASSGQSYQWDLFRIDENLPVGQFSYELQCYTAGQFSSGGAGMEARFLYWKR